MTRLTDQAHELIAAVLQSGETAIDATAGNGHDSLFLCQKVGLEGSVYALDIQQRALDQTAARLKNAGCSQFKLVCCDHGQLSKMIPSDCHQKIGAIMFNLGYLPGGDHTKITQRDSTLAGIESALALLRPGGILTILAYPGHPGGDEETKAVSVQLSHLSSENYSTEIRFAQSESDSAPRLFVVKKREG